MVSKITKIKILSSISAVTENETRSSRFEKVKNDVKFLTIYFYLLFICGLFPVYFISIYA